MKRIKEEIRHALRGLVARSTAARESRLRSQEAGRGSGEEYWRGFQAGIDVGVDHILKIQKVVEMEEGADRGTR